MGNYVLAHDLGTTGNKATLQPDIYKATYKFVHAKDAIVIEGVKETFDTIEQVYRMAGVADRCRLVVGEGGHRLYADLAGCRREQIGQKLL